MSGWYLKDFPSQVCDAELDDYIFIAIHQIFEAKSFHNVTRADPRVVCLVNEPER